MSWLAMMCSRLVGAGAEHAHRVVVAQHHVLDRLVGDFADAADDVGRHHRRGLGVGHQHRVVADDDAGVRVAFGRVGLGVVGDLAEGDLLFFQIGLAGELLDLGHEGFLKCEWLSARTAVRRRESLRPPAA